MHSLSRLVLGFLLLATFGVGSAQAPSAPQVVGTPTGVATLADVEPGPPSAEVSSLRRDLLAEIREPGWSSAEYGVLVVSLDRGDTLFSVNPDASLAPASNMKLFSTAAALYYLGPDFRFSTYLLGDGEIRDGVLHGDLLLFGTGDPAISGRMLRGSSAVLDQLVDSLYARGVRRIEGDVIGDGSYFDDVRLGPEWNPNDLNAWYGAPISALSFAENVVKLQVLPGGSAGEPARVQTEPATYGLAVTNAVRTVSSGRTSVRFEREADGLVLRGQIARRHPGVVRNIPVVDPANFAAAALYATLRERGIEIGGEVGVMRDAERSRVGFAALTPRDHQGPPPQVLAVHLSPPLSDIIRVTNVRSHNLFAEALLKSVGRIALGDGSFAGGARAVRYMLECEALTDSTTLNIVDGSGLSRLNRVTPRTTIQLLDYMRKDPAWETFHESLPEAGRPRGEGLRRMGGTPASHNLRAKTGTIKRVSSLSGYVTAANGEQLAFSIIANNVPSTWRAKQTEDAIGARLAAFRRPPPPPPTLEPLVPAAAPEPTPLPPTGDSVTAASPTPETTPSPSTPPAAGPEAPRAHTVAQGETLDGIARRYGIAVDALRAANPGVTPKRLQVGQELSIPPADTEEAAEPEVVAPALQTHRVRSGDTLDGIARQYGKTVAEIRQANPQVNPRRLQIGQTIAIPR